MRASSINSFRNTLWPFDLKQLKAIFGIAIPITLQTIFFASKGVTDILMIGQLSEDAVAAVGVAGRALFVAMILLSGIATGGSMLMAQYFGAKDEHGIRRTLAMTWLVSSVVALIPALGFGLYGQNIVGLSTDSVAIRELGHQYLAITGLSLFFVAFNGAVAAGLRSIRQAKLSAGLSAFGVVCNLVLNAILIFGLFGLPALGLKGAAIATLLSCILETLVTFLWIYKGEHMLRLSGKCFRSIGQLTILSQFITLALPTTFNFLLWAGGLFTYTALMGQASTQGLVVLSVISPIEAFSLSFLTGIANASAVIIGNHLGAKDKDQAYEQAIGFVVLAIGITVLVSLVLFAIRAPVLNLFSALSTDSYEMAEQFYGLLCFGIILRSLPTTMVVGVLRAGGDVKFCLYQDLITQWLIGIPLVAIAVLLLGWSPTGVFALFFVEAICKWFACIRRFRTRLWLRTLTH